MPIRKPSPRSTNNASTPTRGTLADVAREAGVTKSTVSFAFSGKRKISESTRERIFAIARELNYQPNPHAQRLSSGTATGVVGLIALPLDHMAWLTMSRLNHHLATQGYEAPLYTFGYSFPGPAHRQKLISTACRQQPEGIIFNSLNLQAQDYEILEEYQQKGGALVCLRSSSQLSCDQIVFDRNENTYLAANHLLRAGHRKIGLCTFGAADPNTPRHKGFERALAEYNLKSNPEWLFEAGLDEEGGAALAAVFLKLKKRPSAICIVNDMQAATFVHKLLRAGVRIPEDLSVVSLDGMPAAQHGMVPLTVVTQPWQDMADTAVQFLQQQMKETKTPRKIVFTGEIIERDSVLKLN